MGTHLRFQALEGGVSDRLDRLASLLREHRPDRLAAFWRELPTMGRKKTKQTGPFMLEEAIKDRMKSLGLTAYAAGKLSGMSPTTIQRFLNGQRGLTL